MSDQTPETPAELRAAADRGRKLERENAFLKAGIDTDDPRMRYFVEGYQGDLTKEAIVAEATTAGFITTPEPPKPEQEPPITEEPPASRREATSEERQFEEMAEIGSETGPAGVQQEPDRSKVAWDEFESRRKDGARREDAGSAVLNSIIEGAMAGDPKFVVK